MNTVKKENELLDVDDAARYLGLKASCLTVWRHHHKGPSYLKLGGKIRYRIDDLDKFLRASRVEIKKSA